MPARASGSPNCMHQEITHVTQDEMERELQEMLREEADQQRPDRRRPRGNPAPQDADVIRGREQLDRVL